MSKNEEYAIQTQGKFDFYFLGLVFTILGLSVQTAQFSSWIQSLFEVGAWVALLISGLAGLSRIEWIPIMYAFHSDQDEQKLLIRKATHGESFQNELGHSLQASQIEERVRKTKGEVEERATRLRRLEWWTVIMYKIHKWLFVCAMALLIVSRAVNLYSSRVHTVP
jgi:hypothetical protein